MNRPLRLPQESDVTLVKVRRQFWKRVVSCGLTFWQYSQQLWKYVLPSWGGNLGRRSQSPLLIVNWCKRMLESFTQARKYVSFNISISYIPHIVYGKEHFEITPSCRYKIEMTANIHINETLGENKPMKMKFLLVLLHISQDNFVSCDWTQFKLVQEQGTLWPHVTKSQERKNCN